MSQSRRIQKEFSLIDSRYFPVLAEDFSSISFLLKNKIVKIVFTKDYPFRKPNIFIDNVDYAKYQQLPFALQKIHLMFKRDCCLVCQSYACADRWTVSVRIVDIIKEVDEKLDYIATLEKLGILMVNGLNIHLLTEYV